MRPARRRPSGNTRHTMCIQGQAATTRRKGATHKALPGVEPGFPSQGGGIGLVPATFLPGRGP